MGHEHINYAITTLGIFGQYLDCGFKRSLGLDEQYNNRHSIQQTAYRYS